MSKEDMHKEDIRDLMEVDSWEHTVDYLHETNEALEHRFAEFTSRADKWLLEEWKKRLTQKRQKLAPWDTKESIERFEEIVGILERVIAEREAKS